MSIARRRIDKGWTQEQLAEVAGLSARTVQRIESGKSANLESLKCLASVFETNVADLIKEQEMQNQIAEHADLEIDGDQKSYRETEAIKYVKNLKEFYRHLIVFVIVAPCLVAFNAWLTPGVWWVVWAIFPWGFAVAMHFLTVFGFLNLLGPKWEQRQFQKRMEAHDNNRADKTGN
ncbi:2TM domain-containing protein [Maritalea sp.]|uniref:2TM domain-containing protein n=1 Tax=Maritalea sp. TaxID=2003361 RepID=UPI003EF6D076